MVEESTAAQGGTARSATLPTAAVNNLPVGPRGQFLGRLANQKEISIFQNLAGVFARFQSMRFAPGLPPSHWFAGFPDRNQSNKSGCVVLGLQL